MKKVSLCLVVVCLLAIAAFSPANLCHGIVKADEKPKTEAPSTAVKIQIVITEFDGEKKVKSLPYTICTNSPVSADYGSATFTKIRVGTRVPVYTGNDQLQYQEIGTNIDARAAYTDKGNLLLQLSIERSWVEGDVSVPVAKVSASQPDASGSNFREPIFRQFKSSLDLKLREGQPVESTVATDPISGKVVKVDVSFTVVK